MKRVCKNVDISSPALIEKAVRDCLRPAAKRKRDDTRRLFRRLLRVCPKEARRALVSRNELYEKGVALLVENLRQRILSLKLDLPPITQELRRDPSSFKLRKISILSIEQLLFDHVAVEALRELAARVGEYQVSSIRGRGAAYGKRAIERWLKKRSCRYACKMDIRDFYGSIKRPLLLRWIACRIKNKSLLWLISSLLYSSPNGMAIGSFLSQSIANIYLSDIYHFAMEACISKRGGASNQALSLLYGRYALPLFEQTSAQVCRL